MQMFLYSAVALLVLASCTEAGQPEKASRSRQAPSPVVSLQAFDQSAFLKKYPPRERRARPRKEGGTVFEYRFDDPGQAGKTVTLELAPNRDAVTSVLVLWQGSSPDRPRGWSSIKKQFHADLLESTFWDVDYGELSAYLMEHGKEAYPEGMSVIPRGRIGAVDVYAGVTGGTLAVGLER